MPSFIALAIFRCQMLAKPLGVYGFP